MSDYVFKFKLKGKDDGEIIEKQLFIYIKIIIKDILNLYVYFGS